MPPSSPVPLIFWLIFSCGSPPRSARQKNPFCLQNVTAWQVFYRKTEPLVPSADGRRYTAACNQQRMRRNKTRDMCVGFVTPTQRSWSASFGYRSMVSPEPYFVYRGLLKSPIRCHIDSGASTPMSFSTFSMVCFAARHRVRRASRTAGSASLMRQAL